MLEKGKEDDMIKAVHDSMSFFTVLSHIPWGMALALRTSFGVKELLDFFEWVHNVLVERKKVGPCLLNVRCYIL